MIFVEVLESLRCLDEGVLTGSAKREERAEAGLRGEREERAPASPAVASSEGIADGNIGSIFGIGFPAWTGGVFQYVQTYSGGAAGFAARARELADAHGPRFTPPESLGGA